MRTFTFFLTLVCFLVIDLRAQTVQWAKLQDTSSPSTQIGSIYGPRQPTLVSDGLDLISAGYIADSITLGNHTFAGNNFKNSYLAKNSPNGTVLWAHHLVGANHVGVTTDANKNIFIAGYYTDSLHIGTLIFGPPGKNNTNFFTAKFTPQGTLLWARYVTTASWIPLVLDPNFAPRNTVWGLPISTDGNGNVYTAAYFNQWFAAGSVTFNAVGTSGLFLVKYDSSGTLQWAKNIGSSPTFSEYSPALIGGITNDVYLATASNYTGGNIPLPVNGPYGYFLRKYDVNGIEQWAKFASHRYIMDPIYLSRDAAENVYMAGRINSPVVFGSQLVSPPAVNSMGSFLVKISPGGAWKWVKGVPGPIGEEFHGMANQTKNELKIIKFIPTPYSYNGSMATSIRLVKLDTSGAIVNSFTINNIPTTYATHWFSLTQLAADDFGNTYFTGLVAGSINIGGVTLNAALPVGSRWEPSSTYIGKLQGNLTGLKETAAPLVKLYPNPAQNQVTIETSFSKGKPVTVRLVNLVGQVVTETTLPANNQSRYQMPVNNLPKGVYLVQLETEAGVQAKRLVVQ